ncbi:MAG: tripartite tricarboxylate transporter TctB family protein [Alphaproteobacteria bacterium]
MNRLSKNFTAGLFLLAIAAIAFWQAGDLSAGSFSQIGPGMLPRILAALTGLSGAILIASTYRQKQESLERWSLQALIFILGAVVAFGLAVRPLGLIVAGPLALSIAIGASSERRLIEILIFGLVMTGFCVLLFKILLGLPIPVAPWLIGY